MLLKYQYNSFRQRSRFSLKLIKFRHIEVAETRFTPLTPAFAWWDAAGHVQIAYVAYKHSDAPVKDKVDVPLKLHADYAKWTAGALDDKAAKIYAFIRAATWASDSPDSCR
jgi:hypothetical protein